MVYILLNIFLCVAFIFMAALIDRTSVDENHDTSGISISLLLCTIQVIFFTLILLLKGFWLARFTSQLMKIVYTLDGISSVMLGFSLTRITRKQRTGIFTLLRVLVYIFIAYICIFRFNDITVRLENGILVQSGFIFNGEARTYFPWTWFQLYFALSKVIFPFLFYLGYTVEQEDNINQLYRYRCLVVGQGLVVMWVIYGVIQFLSNRYLKINLLYAYPSLFLYLMIFSAMSKNNVPSAKGIFVGIFRVCLTYFLPASLIGILFIFLRPKNNYFEISFIIPFAIAATGAVILSVKFNDIFSSVSRIYASDYEASLEKELAGIVYADAEMDDIISKMLGILKQTVETSSMDIYMTNSLGELEAVYNSSGKKSAAITDTSLLDSLLNINRNVLSYMEIDQAHDLSEMTKQCYSFLEKTKSDSFVILNEGHNIFGLICLGKKISGDHFTANDSQIFKKLYSYFFVFGYYMRNIANKDIMGIVNREIRMSSQIITSIQENIDKINNPKIDLGYLMIPAKNIGGEFIDIIRLTDKRYLFVVGDLSGKGIAASMNMVILKSIIRAYLSETHNFKELVVKLNDFIRNSLRKGTIFAGLFAIIDFESDTLYYINCGIPALFSYTQVYNNIIEIQGSGHILGFVQDISPYVTIKSVKLSRGDILVCCTDGLIQSHSLRGEQFGRERVTRAILDNSTYPAQRMSSFIFDSLKKFMSKEMEDDVSILVMKYESAAKFVEQEAEQASAEASAAADAVSQISDADFAGNNDTAASASLDSVAEQPGAAAENSSASSADVASSSGAANSSAGAMENVEDSFFTEDNSTELSATAYAAKKKELDNEVKKEAESKAEASSDKPDAEEKASEKAEERTEAAASEQPKIVIEHEAPPEGFDTSELSELDDLLSDVGL